MPENTPSRITVTVTLELDAETLEIKRCRPLGSSYEEDMRIGVEINHLCHLQRIGRIFQIQTKGGSNVT